MKHHVSHIALACLLALAAVACDGSVYTDQSQSVSEQGWLPADSLLFHVEAADTTTPFHFLIGIRNSITYPYSNAFLFIRTTFPDGSTAQDTLECPLSDAEGHWYGKRTGRYVDARYYFRRNARFPMTGTYRFAITNGMRDSAIAGLKDISLRVEYANLK
ncbi:MAG: gliding motility lipoprotein GldH [Bacteroidales bacterium]|nr:gliding motility lipoprotein GldH [Bacteroidales bacterium]